MLRCSKLTLRVSEAASAVCGITFHPNGMDRGLTTVTLTLLLYTTLTDSQDSGAGSDKITNIHNLPCLTKTTAICQSQKYNHNEVAESLTFLTCSDFSICPKIYTYGVRFSRVSPWATAEGAKLNITCWLVNSIISYSINTDCHIRHITRMPSSFHSQYILSNFIFKLSCSQFSLFCYVGLNVTKIIIAGKTAFLNVNNTSAVQGTRFKQKGYLWCVNEV